MFKKAQLRWTTIEPVHRCCVGPQYWLCHCEISFVTFIFKPFNTVCFFFLIVVLQGFPKLFRHNLIWTTRDLYGKKRLPLVIISSSKTFKVYLLMCRVFIYFILFFEPNAQIHSVFNKNVHLKTSWTPCLSGGSRPTLWEPLLYSSSRKEIHIIHIKYQIVT